MLALRGDGDREAEVGEQADRGSAVSPPDLRQHAHGVTGPAGNCRSSSEAAPQGLAPRPEVQQAAHRGHRPDCDKLVRPDAAAVSHVQAGKEDA